MADLVDLCRKLEAKNARYMVVGGFAIIALGLGRMTSDIDFLIDPSAANEAEVFDVLATLPDMAVRELDPGDVGNYIVVRVVDEVTVDLMAAASGITYEEASRDTVVREIDGVRIPFASPRLMWRMKRRAGREKDLGDLVFLRDYFKKIGELPPSDLESDAPNKPKPWIS